MKKPSEWRQDTPRQQIAVCLQSVWGNVNNVMENRAMHPEEALRLALTHLEDAQEILKRMPEGEWWYNGEEEERKH